MAGPVKLCMNCDHWSATKRALDSMGDCRIRAPIVVNIAPARSAFPVCPGNAWCSEFKPYTAADQDQPTA